MTNDDPNTISREEALIASNRFRVEKQGEDLVIYRTEEEQAQITIDEALDLLNRALEQGRQIDIE